jgi:hypothetical protein
MHRWQALAIILCNVLGVRRVVRRKPLNILRKNDKPQAA